MTDDIRLQKKVDVWYHGPIMHAIRVGDLLAADEELWLVIGFVWNERTRTDDIVFKIWVPGTVVDTLRLSEQRFRHWLRVGGRDGLVYLARAP